MSKPVPYLSGETIERDAAALRAWAVARSWAFPFPASHPRRVATTNARRRASRLPFRPKVYFEEWDDPMISGIAWVSELIEIAGGIDVFADLAHCKSAKDRIVNGEQIIARAPDIIVGSWCGKKFRPEKVVNRAGFDALPAVRRGAVHEIKSPLILQPGPAALTDGLAAMEAIIANSVAAYDRRTV